MNNTVVSVSRRRPAAYSGAGVNWTGFWTLYSKEVQRFLKVIGQTVGAPAVTTLLFMLVFAVALGPARPDVGGVPFVRFLAPGLIMMAVLQNAFMNASSSLLVAKINGSVTDVLMPPLGAGELTAAFVLGAVTRGAVVGLAAAAALLPFHALGIVHPWAVLYFGFAGALMLGTLGTLAGVWAEKVDHVAVVTNFVVTPLTFLSGTFYPADRLSGFWYKLSHVNPFFFFIDGFRYGCTGRASGDLAMGIVLTLAVNIALLAACYGVFARGYKLKS